MIAKIMKPGAGFKGAIEYITKDEKGEVLESSGVFGEADAWPGQMRSVADSNSSCHAPVVHAILSCPPGEHPTDDQWRAASKAWMSEMKLDPAHHQFVLAIHNDKGHAHCHIVANRIDLETGKAWSDSNSRYRSHSACRVAEQASGLQSFSGKQSERGQFAGIRGSINRALSTGSSSLEQFKDRLAENNIKVIESRQSTGRIHGLSFVAQDGKPIKGSSLGRGYGLGALQKKGLKIGDEKSPNIQKLGARKAASKVQKIGGKISDRMNADLDRAVAASKSNVRKKEIEL